MTKTTARNQRKRRLAMVARYTGKRRTPIGHYWVPAYIDWVDGFARFMKAIPGQRRK